ncbi:MAG TPA: ATP-binding protein [Bryobacteraceae bacterium]|jgi:uncharacterized protein (TIGR00290 family)
MRALISWSGGKDSAFALRRARESGVEPVALLTSFNEATDQIPIHDIPMSWIRRHAEMLGLPLRTVPLPWPCSNDEYLGRMRAVWGAAAAEMGADCIVFGDIHLEDIREFRERGLAGSGLTPIFPLWGYRSMKLAADIISAGINATIASVDERRLARELVGRRFDAGFVADLPADVDPCGENGEFHTAVWL